MLGTIWIMLNIYTGAAIVDWRVRGRKLIKPASSDYYG